jgi:hypothetical protein
LTGDVTGEDTTRILTRLPPSGNASVVLTHRQNLFAGDDNDTHITEETFCPKQKPDDGRVQNYFYNGWTSNQYINNLSAFALDGIISAFFS